MSILSTLKYLGLGLLIGMAGTALIVTAAIFSRAGAEIIPVTYTALPTATFAPSSTAVMVSPSPTTIPTYTAIPPLTSFASPTLSAEPSETVTPDAIESTVNAGELIFSGPLSNAQQKALFKASLAYVQSTVEGSLRLAKQINGVGYGDSNNICGPLAIAIMRDAGLVSPDLKPHDFWLLNPLASSDQALLKRTFPSDRYLYTKSITPLNKMDWRGMPLEPGDFLFIWHGSGGNFDHILVVSRVDSSLRTYAVTNYGTPSGFVIAETMLYDPNDPSAGIFHTWTQERYAILGSTGFGGFELWRLRQP